MTNDFETELKMGFLEEATQLLADAEQCFLQLESSGGEPALLDKLFRLAHNLKGSARAVGFGEMAEFTHELESLLLKLKNGEISVTPPIVSLLLRCKDYLEQLVQTLKGDLHASVKNSELLFEVKAAIESKIIASTMSETIAVEAQTSESLMPTPAAQEWEPITLSQEKTSKTNSDESIRVSLGRVEKLINFVGELVILQTVLQEQHKSSNSPLLTRTISEISKVTKEIQSISMGLRMLPLKPTFQKMQRIVRDTAMQVNKAIHFQMSGEDTELDKTVLENINDPLVHLVRNAVDHGIESSELRSQRAKPLIGTIRLKAYQQADRIIIEVQDDGGGLDPARIRAKAVEKKIISDNEVLSESETLKLIFKPGFSTKSEVTDISGRGVGLDVVKTNIESVLHGDVQIHSELEKGTTFKISLPLTLAIADGMVVKTGKERYIIPLTQVFETLRPQEKEIHFVSGMGELLHLRGENLPIYRLNRLLKRKFPAGNSNEPKITDSIAIVVRSGKSPFAVAVDDIIGQHQVVLKRLGPEVRQIKGFAGSAILGDGIPGVILDLPELIAA